ncbi:MAG: hypothetical protein ACLQVI_16340, partial [Polyangiaceae bacterium]
MPRRSGMRVPNGGGSPATNVGSAYLKIRGWHVERMIGNAFQMGVPDLFIAHLKWGQRWIDVK